MVNFPHNPTGALPSPAEWADVVATAERAGALLVSDEMYRGLEYDAGRRLVPAAAASERGVSIAGLSKAYGLPGLRVGWLATRDRAAARGGPGLQGLHHHLRERALANGSRWWRSRTPERLVERCREIVAANRPLLEAFLARQAERFAWRPPLAGPIAFARFHPGDAAAFCERLALAAGVMLLPSSVFEWGDSHVRFGFGRTSFPEALAALERHLRLIAQARSGAGSPASGAGSQKDQISLRGLGRPKKKPCACVKPMRMQTSASSAVSTPSATV